MASCNHTYSSSRQFGQGSASFLVDYFFLQVQDHKWSYVKWPSWPIGHTAIFTITSMILGGECPFFSTPFWLNFPIACRSSLDRISLGIRLKTHCWIELPKVQRIKNYKKLMKTRSLITTVGHFLHNISDLSSSAYVFLQKKNTGT